MAHRFLETNTAHLPRNDRKRTPVIVDTLATLPGVVAGDFRFDPQTVGGSMAAT